MLLGGVVTTVGQGLLGSTVYSDVPRGSYFDDAVGALYEAGIMTGSNGRFRPGDTLNRAEMATIVQRLRNEMHGVSNVPSQEPSPEPTPSSQREEEEVRTSSSTTSRTTSSKKSSASAKQNAGVQGAVQFSTDQFTIPESAKGLTIGVQRLDGDKDNVAVQFEVVAVTATEGKDYYKNGGTLNFREGETSKTFTILLMNDTDAEGPETVTIRLKSPTSGLVLGKYDVATVTILDDERSNNTSSTSTSSTSGNTSSTSTSSSPTAGTLNLAAFGYVVNEKAGTLNVTVNRTGGTTGAVNVNYATEAGTAKSGTEFTSVSGTLSYNDGETSKSFTVPVTDNSGINGNKNFTVKLSSPTGGAVLGYAASALATINDDESAPYGTGSLKIGKSTFDAEEGKSLYVTVVRSGGAAGTVGVAYSTTSGTASGNDFSPVAGTLTFAPGESTKLIMIPITQDSDSDSGETFYVNISNATGGAEITIPSSSTVTIYQ